MHRATQDGISACLHDRFRTQTTAITRRRSIVVRNRARRHPLEHASRRDSQLRRIRTGRHQPCFETIQGSWT